MAKHQLLAVQAYYLKHREYSPRGAINSTRLQNEAICLQAGESPGAEPGLEVIGTVSSVRVFLLTSVLEMELNKLITSLQVQVTNILAYIAGQRARKKGNTWWRGTLLCTWMHRCRQRQPLRYRTAVLEK